MINSVKANVNLAEKETASEDNQRYFTIIHPKISQFSSIILCTKTGKDKIKFDAFSVNFNIPLHKKCITKISFGLDVSPGEPQITFPVDLKKSSMINDRLNIDVTETEYLIGQSRLKEFLPFISKSNCQKDSLEQVLNNFRRLFCINIETDSKIYKYICTVIVLSKSSLLKSDGSAYCLINKRSKELLNFTTGKVFKNYLLESPSEKCELDLSKKPLKRKREEQVNKEKVVPKKKRRKSYKDEDTSLRASTRPPAIPAKKIKVTPDEEGRDDVVKIAPFHSFRIHKSWFNYAEPHVEELLIESEEDVMIEKAAVTETDFNESELKNLLDKFRFLPSYL